MQRLYVIPVKYQCNADCTFCITEEAKLHPAFNNVRERLKLSDAAEFCKNFSMLDLKELEITGGGEPFLNQQLQDIIHQFKATWPTIYTKVYTNGFLLKPIIGIDELNISHAHDDTGKNNLIFRAKAPTSLIESISFYRPLVKKLRVQVPLLRGCIDTPDAAIAFIERHPTVDQFVFRPLFSKVQRDKEKFIDFQVLHPRAKNDLTGDYCGKRPVLASNGRLYWDWDYTRVVEVSDIPALNQSLKTFNPIKAV